MRLHRRTRAMNRAGSASDRSIRAETVRERSTSRERAVNPNPKRQRGANQRVERQRHDPSEHMCHLSASGALAPTGYSLQPTPYVPLCLIRIKAPVPNEAAVKSINACREWRYENARPVGKPTRAAEGRIKPRCAGTDRLQYIRQRTQKGSGSCLRSP